MFSPVSAWTCRFLRSACASLLSLVACANAAAAEGPIAAREQLNSVLWMHSAAEYRMLATQVYAAATAALETAANKPCASWEQRTQSATTCNDRRRRPAVVLDVDETVLDNSAFQRRLVLDGQEFVDSEWNRWVASKRAMAIPGAIQFVKAALDRKYEVFFVTNRACETPPPEPAFVDRYYDASGHSLVCPQKTATMETMRALGFPAVAEDHFLLAQELLVRNDAQDAPKSWQARKDRRRTFIADKFGVRIAMLIGDDLRDFVEREVWQANEAQLMPFVGTPMVRAAECDVRLVGVVDRRKLSPERADRSI